MSRCRLKTSPMTRRLQVMKGGFLTFNSFVLNNLVFESCKKFFEGSESSEPSDEECEDYDDLDLDGLSNQAAEMDLEGRRFLREIIP